MLFCTGTFHGTYVWALLIWVASTTGKMYSDRKRMNLKERF